MLQTQYSFEVIDVDGKRHQVRTLDKALLFNDSALVKVFNGYKLVKIVSVNEIKKETKMMFPNTKTVYRLNRLSAKPSIG